MGPSEHTMALARQALLELDGGDAATRVKACQAVKNCIIGSAAKKRLFLGLGLLPKVLGAVQCPEAPEGMLLHGLPILSSCCLLPDLDADARGAILEAVQPLLHHPSPPVVEAALRVVKTLWAGPAAPPPTPPAAPLIGPLVRLLAAPDARPMVPEWAAMVLARLCCERDHCAEVLRLGAMPHLLLLLLSPNGRVQAAALDCLAMLVRGHDDAPRALVEARFILPALLTLVQAPAPTTRLAAARTLTALYPTLSPGPEAGAVRGPLLPLALGLLSADCPAVREAAPAVLADLLSGDDAMAQAAGEADGVAQVSAALEMAQALGARHGCLVALAAMCGQHDDCRRAVIHSKVLPRVCAALGDPDPTLRLAACRCAQALSRTPTPTRAVLAEALAGAPFTALLQDLTPAVPLSALALLTNLVLEFPTMKTAVAESPLCALAAQFAQSPLAVVRVAGLALLRNLVCRAPISVRQRALAVLPLSTCLDLLDAEDATRLQVLRYVRNLLAPPSPALLATLDPTLPPFLEKTAALTQAALQQSGELAGEVVENALWVLGHLASADARADHLPLGPMLPLVAEALQRGPESVQHAAAWAVCNLVWPRPGDGAVRGARRAQLHAAGVLEALHPLRGPRGPLAVRAAHAADLLLAA